MTESISEGTLRPRSKQIGDTADTDREVATIEPNKVRPRQPQFTYDLSQGVSRQDRCHRQHSPFPERSLNTSQRKSTPSLSDRGSSEWKVETLVYVALQSIFIPVRFIRLRQTPSLRSRRHPKEPAQAEPPPPEE